MNWIKLNQAIFFVAININFILGCTSNSSSSSSSIPMSLDPINSLTPSAPTNPINSSAIEAEKVVSELQQNLNKDSQYLLSNDDLTALTNEGLSEASELTGWIKQYENFIPIIRKLIFIHTSNQC